MMKPVWLQEEGVLAIQESLIGRFGGLSGLRDAGLLESALSRPQQLYHYGKPTLFEMAAAYAAGLVKNHPFLDGNKRIGFLAAYVFLGINHQIFQAPEEEVVLQTLGLAAGLITEAEYARWLEQSCAHGA